MVRTLLLRPKKAIGVGMMIWGRGEGDLKVQLHLIKTAKCWVVQGRERRPRKPGSWFWQTMVESEIQYYTHKLTESIALSELWLLTEWYSMAFPWASSRMYDSNLYTAKLCYQSVTELVSKANSQQPKTKVRRAKPISVTLSSVNMEKTVFDKHHTTCPSCHLGIWWWNSMLSQAE